MLFAMKIKIAITLAALASPVALSVAPVGRGSVDAGFTAIPARPFQYRMAGDFSRDGKPAGVSGVCAQLDSQPVGSLHRVSAGGLHAA